MIAKTYSAALQGINSRLIEIEVASTFGLRSFNIVGLADKSIEEAKERIGSAIKSTGLASPQAQSQRIVVNLAPADLKKEGAHYDLPIAVAYLLSSKQIRCSLEKRMILGELALDGKIKPVKGVLCFALLAAEQSFEEIIIPKQNAKEALLALFFTEKKKKPKVIDVETLKDLIFYLEKKKEHTEPKLSREDFKKEDSFEVDISWIKGQEHAKRALEIAAAGGHNVLLQGPPGTGKSLLAKSIVSIMPKLKPQEILEINQIYSAYGILKKDSLLYAKRPFRSPHHSSSEVAILGGGNPPLPGEITLANRGVLFLDELPEFHRDVLESLRQPLEDGEITIKRAKYNISFPAKFILIAAANPCPCGYYNDPEHECSCTSSQIASYRRKLSGPLMDRIDMFLWVGSLKYKDLTSSSSSNNPHSSQIKQRVERAREIQEQRFKEQHTLLNAEMNLEQIKKYCQIDSRSHALLRRFVDSGKLSARGYHRVLKVARTIADLEEKENIDFENVAESLMYRIKEND